MDLGASSYPALTITSVDRATGTITITGEPTTVVFEQPCYGTTLRLENPEDVA